MSAEVLDGKAIAAALRGRVKDVVEARIAAGEGAPGLATVLVGDDPASHVYVGNKRRACEQAGIRSIHHEPPADDPRGRARCARRRARSRPRGGRHPRSDAASRPHRSGRRAGGDIGGQGRRRIDARERGPARTGSDRRTGGHRPRLGRTGRRADPLHARRRGRDPRPIGGRALRGRGGRDRPLDPRRPADGQPPRQRGRDRDRLPLPDPRPRRRLPERGRLDRGGRPPRDGQGRLDQARRHRDRRRHEQDRCRGSSATSSSTRPPPSPAGSRRFPAGSGR